MLGTCTLIAERQNRMAHRTNITQVPTSLPENPEGEKVRDPICGMQMDRKLCKHVLFRPDETYYFCSRDCKDQFISPRKKAPAA